MCYLYIPKPVKETTMNRLMSVASTNDGAPVDGLISIFDPSHTERSPRSLANRTITGKMFSGLMVTDSMHSLMTHFFTAHEIRKLELDAARPK